MVSQVVRSPRRLVRFRAVLSADAERHPLSVVDMSTSGLLFRGRQALGVGDKIAVVMLFGVLDSERLPAEVTRVAVRADGTREFAVRFLALPPAYRTEIRALTQEQTSSSLFRRSPLLATPSDAAVIYLSDEQESAFHSTVAEVWPTHVDVQDQTLDQLVEMGKRNSALVDENQRLRSRIEMLEARVFVRDALHARLRTTEAKLADKCEELDEAHELLHALIDKFNAR